MHVNSLTKRRLLTSAIVVALSTPAGVVIAQDDADDDGLIEEVVVTGSYIKRQSQFDTPAPLTVVDKEDLSAIGATTVADVVNKLTINTGSQNNPDAFTQNNSTGTSNINLRGLGVGSTLILLNGRRQVQTSIATDNGENFVDTASLVPLIAVDRVETLKDGAAALYGSDAVAGVVNFITRDDFRGFEIETEYQTTTEDSQEDVRFSAIWGTGNDTTDFVVSFSYLDRSPLTTAERRLPLSSDVSIFGQPGSYIVPFQPSGPNPVFAGVWSAAFDANGNGVADFFEGTSATLPVLADPACLEIAQQDDNIIPPATFPAGTCNFDFGDFFNLVAEEERMQIFAEVNSDLSNGMTFHAEFGYADNEAERGNSPSFPVLALPAIPADNPFNPFGVPVNLVGRAIGAFGEPFNGTYSNETWRIAASLDGSFNDNWGWSLSFTNSENESQTTAGDTLADRFFAALAGQGGPNNNQFYNPFGSQYSTDPNDPAVIADFTARAIADSEADEFTFQGIATGEVFEMAGGNAGLAVGFQYRDNELSYDYDANSNADNFLFVVGNPDFSADRDVTALFGELVLPISDTLEAQLAVRFEDYGGDLDSTDPKAAILWRPSDAFTLRASVGSSFRAPSLFQQFGTQTSLVQLIDPLNPGLAFRAVRSQGDPNNPLRPEEADAFNIGASWAVGSNWEFGIDYWSFDYTDIIIQESAQAVLLADPNGPQVIRDPDTGVLLRVNTFFTNAASLETDGFDLTATADWDTDIGTIGFSAEATLVTGYDLEDPQLGSIDGAGSRNFNNFGTSVPETRANIGLSWSRDRHSAFAFVRHIDSYQDDQNDLGIDSFTTLDLQYNYQTQPFGVFNDGINLSIGAINALDEDIPGVVTNGGFDSKVHDPRGRLAYIRANFGF